MKFIKGSRFRGIISFFLFFIIQIVVALVFNLLSLDNTPVFFQLLASASIIAILILLIDNGDLKSSIKSSIFKLSTYMYALVGFIIYLVAIAITTFILQSLFGKIAITENQDNVVAAAKEVGLFIAFITIVVAAPIYEELVFRYSLIRAADIKIRFLKWFPYLLSALIFASIHEYAIYTNFTGETIKPFMLYFIPSLVMVALYAKTNRNILTTIILHMLINFISFLGMV